jgi:hypothetical protein
MLVASAYGYARSKRPEGITINHVTTFTLGFLFYWLLPVILIVTPTTDAAEQITNYFSAIPPDRLLGYNISILFCYLAFALGDTLGTFPLIKRKRVTRPRKFQPQLWKLEWASALILFVIELVKVRHSLFTSYTHSDFIARGTLIAVSIVLFSISLRIAIEGRWKFMQAYFIVALALLAAGGRLYFVSSVISLLAYISHRKPIRSRVLLVGGVCAMALMGIIGVLRVHSSASLLLILLNVVTESLFTSFSLFSYLSANPISWIHAPTFLIADLYNLIPSALVNKHHLTTLVDSGLGIASPMGAMHSWVSFNVNFGIIGTLIFMFLFGYLLRINEKMSVPYLMLTGFTAFTFFRDPFSVSLVKNMLEFSILIPLFLEQINRLCTFAVKTSSEFVPSLHVD